MNWEYIYAYLGYNESEELNEFGKLGWELVSVILPNDELPKAYFKRPLRTKSEAEILAHFDKLQQDRSSEV